MDRTWALLLTAGVGGLLAMQAPINGQLGMHVGKLQAALISFVVGTVLLSALVFVFAGGFEHGLGIGTVPWYYFIGGLLGAGYITTVIITVGTLGAGGITAATVSAQLVTSMVLDQIGAFGLEKHPITWTRLLGVLLLAVGTWLVVAGRG
ncbi:MAG: DMT family transporter [Solirubrobacterales bacterium]